MKTFKDSNSVEWQIAVNTTSVKRVRDLLNGFDLFKVVETRDIGKLIEDPELLVNVVYCLCKPQADERKITDAQFGEAMVGDAIDAATAALLEDFVSFFPKARRGLMEKALKKIRQMETLAVETAHKRLDGPELESELQRLASGSSFTSVPGSRVLTPGP